MLSKVQSKIRSPANCSWRLCKDFLHGVGFLWTSGPCKFIIVLFINRTISAFLFFVLFFLTYSVTNWAIVHVYYARANNLSPYGS